MRTSPPLRLSYCDNDVGVECVVILVVTEGGGYEYVDCNPFPTKNIVIPHESWKLFVIIITAPAIIYGGDFLWWQDTNLIVSSPDIGLYTRKWILN